MRHTRIEGKAVATLRLKLGMTQQELAARVGCSLSAVQFWEAGRSSPRGYRLRRLVELCPDAETRALFLPAGPAKSLSASSLPQLKALGRDELDQHYLDPEFMRSLPADTNMLYQATVKNVLELGALKMQGNQVAAEGLRLLAETIIQIAGLATDPAAAPNATAKGSALPRKGNDQDE